MGGAVRVGLMLPTFAARSDGALDAAVEADRVGVHGVFAYDHLWPMGEPGEPAISPYPVLGGVAMVTRRIRLGTLVSRVGLVDDDVLVSELASIDELSGGRLTAGIGTGDHKSKAENLAYGVPMTPVADRQASVEAVVSVLVASGVDTWVGGGLASTNAIARATGATLNLWGAKPEVVAAAAADGPVSWGGAWPKSSDPAELLAGLSAAGASWAVFTWPGSVTALVDAARRAGIELGGDGL